MTPRTTLSWTILGLLLLGGSVARAQEPPKPPPAAPATASLPLKKHFAAWKRALPEFCARRDIQLKEDGEWLLAWTFEGLEPDPACYHEPAAMVATAQGWAPIAAYCPRSITTRDVDGDGRQDLIISHAACDDPDRAERWQQVCLNHPDGPRCRPDPHARVTPTPPPTSPPPPRLDPTARYRKWRLTVTPLCARERLQVEEEPAGAAHPVWVYAHAFEGTMPEESECQHTTYGQIFSSRGEAALPIPCPGGVQLVDFDRDNRLDALVYSTDCAGPFEGSTLHLCRDADAGPDCTTLAAEVQSSRLVRRGERLLLQVERCEGGVSCWNDDPDAEDIRRTWEEIHWDGRKLVTTPYTTPPPEADEVR